MVNYILSTIPAVENMDIPAGMSAEMLSKEGIEKTLRMHMGSTRPHIEGAFMNKHNGKYYLQYAAPGTQYNIYSNGVYVSDSPLGTFTYQKHNPFSSKPGGFITGAGHGSTFKDKFGNWWHASTMVISVNENFERRVGLFPCDIDSDGVLFCNQNFADYPFYLSEGIRNDINKIEPDMMLLSYEAKAEASSFLNGYEPNKGVDENVRTWWAAETVEKNEWYKIDLSEVINVKAIQLNFADHKHPMPEGWEENAKKSIMEKRLILTEAQRTRYLLEGSEDGENWFVIKDCRNGETDFTHDLIHFDIPIELRYVKVSQIVLALDGIPAISGLRVFGKGHELAPAPVSKIDFVRSEERMNILLNWESAPDADGYNVRYGTASDKLYSSWQVYGNTELDLSTINKNQSYYITVDSFNKNGVTAGTAIYVE
jgi:hypothetical protein